MSGYNIDFNVGIQFNLLKGRLFLFQKFCQKVLKW